MHFAEIAERQRRLENRQQDVYNYYDLRNTLMSEKQPIPVPQTPASLPVEEIRAAVEKVRFGTVQLIIQDGRIVQIDTTEKKRLV